jgi:hypothetical protein
MFRHLTRPRGAAAWITHENWRTEPGIPAGRRNAPVIRARVGLGVFERYEECWDLLDIPTDEVPVLVLDSYRHLMREPRIGSRCGIRGQPQSRQPGARRPTNQARDGPSCARVSTPSTPSPKRSRTTPLMRWPWRTRSPAVRVGLSADTPAASMIGRTIRITAVVDSRPAAWGNGQSRRWRRSRGNNEGSSASSGIRSRCSRSAPRPRRCTAVPPGPCGPCPDRGDTPRRHGCQSAPGSNGSVGSARASCDRSAAPPRGLDQREIPGRT